MSDPEPPLSSEAPDAPPGPSRSRLPYLALAIAAVLILADQLSKSWAMAWLGDGVVREVVPGWLELHLVRNPGAAFSLWLGSTLVFTVIAMVVSVVLAVTIRRVRDPLWALALGLMLGGALGNVIDRWVRDPGMGSGHVVDFIHYLRFPLIDFPHFNLADSGITIAAALILIQSLRGIALDGARHE